MLSLGHLSYLRRGELEPCGTAYILNGLYFFLSAAAYPQLLQRMLRWQSFRAADARRGPAPWLALGLLGINLPMFVLMLVDVSRDYPFYALSSALLYMLWPLCLDLLSRSTDRLFKSAELVNLQAVNLGVALLLQLIWILANPAHALPELVIMPDDPMPIAKLSMSAVLLLAVLLIYLLSRSHKAAAASEVGPVLT